MSDMVPVEPQSKAHPILMAGAAAIAGAAIGKHLSDKQYEKAMKEEIPQSRGIGGPGMVEGSAITEWNRYVADYRTRYGTKLVTMALRATDDLQKHIHSIQKGLDEMSYPSICRVPIIVPYSRRAIESELYRNGTNIYLTGRNLVPFGMISASDFEPDQPLGSPYKLLNGLRGSSNISGYEHAFDPENRPTTLRYIKLMNRVVLEKTNDLFQKFYEMGLPWATIGDPSELMTKISDPIYKPFVILFDMDIRYITQT